jgi:FtsZ-binding cell division protein ZapB
LVEQLSKNIEAQTIDNAVLKEEVENARSNIGKLEVELTGLRNSWCGKLKSLLNK